MAAKHTTVQELAASTEVGERRIRRILRAADLGVGRGKRYQLSAKQVTVVNTALKG